MMSLIEWTQETWNPMRGCRRVSPGCQNCYAERLAATRLAGPGRPYEGLAVMMENGPRWTGVGQFVQGKLDEPLRRRKPTMYFVDSMSDLFFEEFSFEQIAAVFGVMAACPQHTFQVLTKRPARAALFFRWVKNAAKLHSTTPLGVLLHHAQRRCHHKVLRIAGFILGQPWPLPNVWMGTRVEDQGHSLRIDDLLAIPAAVRWISVEPLLEAVWLDRWFGLRVGRHWRPCVCGEIDPSDRPCVVCDGRRALGEASGIDWVVVGGESGPGARRCNVAWIRRVVEQCKAASVPVFVKQLGAHVVDYGKRMHLKSKKGGDLSEWPADLRVREMPVVVVPRTTDLSTADRD